MEGETYEQLLRSYEDFYRTGQYRVMWHNDQPGGELVSLVATGIVPQGASLDLGCGAGTTLLYLAQAGFRAHGIDLAPAAARIVRALARERGAPVEAACGSVLALPYGSASFTLLTDRGCFHHILERDRPVYAKEAARVLRPGGYLLLTGAREGASENFVPLYPDKIEELFSSDFDIGPIQPYTSSANVGTLDVWLTVMRRRA